jgi:Ca2+-binding EF-hand superfamily protein
LERTEILKAAYSDKDLAKFLTPARSNQAYSAMGGGKPVDLASFKQFCRKASSTKLIQVSANEEERTKFKVMFDRLDGNGNGTLERMELYKASHMDLELAQYVAPRQCGEAFKRMDSKNNGKVTLDSFIAFCMDVRSASSGSK